MKRLKIAEQIILVLIIAVVIPLVTIGIVISNISQHSVREELATNARIMAQYGADTIGGLVRYSQAQLDLIALEYKYLPVGKRRQNLKLIESKTKNFKEVSVVKASDVDKKKYEVKNGEINIYSQIDKNKKQYLRAKIELKTIQNLFDEENTKGRNIYVFDRKTKELLITNVKEPNVSNVLENIDIDNAEKVTIFGKKKNTPKVCYKLDAPDWFIVIDTTKKITANTISKARSGIITCLVVAALAIILIVGLYTFYLYVNMRQLFKGITAISKGNYDKKIHLIKSVFTPNETVFIAKEFNYMASKINNSYKDLKKKNKELELLNNFREDLINSTSHEFRTPLTSIIGYTSRLLRHDIQLDNETKIKSLQIIKQQAQRLSKMVEDLLVIPEIDSLCLKVNIEEVDVAEIATRAIEYLSDKDVEFNVDINDEVKPVYADDYRLEQVVINIIDNAIKYSYDKQPVDIILKQEENIPVLIVKNKCEQISDELKEKLFEKFIRVDSNLTRTTRGTGLGLYIVKGLCNAMNIKLSLEVNDEFIMKLKFVDYVE